MTLFTVIPDTSDDGGSEGAPVLKVEVVGDSAFITIATIHTTREKETVTNIAHAQVSVADLVLALGGPQ